MAHVPDEFDAQDPRDSAEPLERLNAWIAIAAREGEWLETALARQRGHLAELRQAIATAAALAQQLARQAQDRQLADAQAQDHAQAIEWWNLTPDPDVDPEPPAV